MGDKAPAEVFAEGVQIGSSLKHLAERRTDIFGVEETIIGMKVGHMTLHMTEGRSHDHHVTNAKL